VITNCGRFNSFIQEWIGVRALAGVAGTAAFFLVAGALALPAASAAGTAQPGTSQPRTVQPGVSQQAALYVVGDAGSQFCSDSFPGTRQYPLCTIQAAANAVQPGQTVVLGPSPYAPTEGTVVDAAPLTITRSGTPSAPITFEGETSGFGNLPSIWPLGYYGVSALTLSGVHDVVFKSLEFDRSLPIKGQVTAPDAVVVTGSRDVIFAGDTVKGISVDGRSSGVTVTQSQLGGLATAPGASGITVTDDLVDAPIALSGAAGADVVGNTIEATCASAVAVTGGSSAVVLENNVLAANGGSQCTSGTPGAALSVDASAAAGTRADYNAVSAPSPDTDYSWAGTAYSSPAGFSAATSQGSHDVAAPQLGTGQVPPEGSALIDSADCSAPAEPSTDVYGNPRADNPLVADTGNGTCHADRGAVELEDDVTPAVSVSPSGATGAAPATFGVTVSSGATSSQWNEPVSYWVSFGDGSALQQATPGVAVQHTYPTPGQYTLTVTGTNASGSALRVTRQVTVLTAQPAKVAVTGHQNADVYGGLIPDQAAFAVNPGVNYWEMTDASIAWGDGTTSSSSTTATAQVHNYPRPGTYAVTLTETDLLGRKSVTTAAITVGDEVNLESPPQPYYSQSLASHAVVKLPGSLPYDRAAFVLVTVTAARKPGYVTVYPDGESRPGQAAVQFRAGQSMSNTVLATFGSDGKVDFYNGSSGTIVLSVSPVADEATMASNGDYDDAGDTYTPVGPVTVLATTKIAGNHHATFTVTGHSGIPAYPTGVVLSVTTSATAAAGHSVLTFPGALKWDWQPESFWAKGQTVTGLGVLWMQGYTKVVLANVGSGAAAFTVQVVGYYQPGSTAGSVFIPASRAVRMLSVTIAGKHRVKLAVAGKNGVPATGTTAVQVNLTASAAAANGSITAYADGTSMPGDPSLSYAAGQANASAAIVAMGKDGATDLYNGGSKPVTLFVDLTGSYYH
jgi:hypothetical protein